jgi:hypothetical protein
MRVKVGRWYYPKAGGGEAYVLSAVRAIAGNILKLDSFRVMFVTSEDYITIDTRNPNAISLGHSTYRDNMDLQIVFGGQRRNNRIAIIAVFNGIEK